MSDYTEDEIERMNRAIAQEGMPPLSDPRWQIDPTGMADFRFRRGGAHFYLTRDGHIHEIWDAE